MVLWRALINFYRSFLNLKLKTFRTHLGMYLFGFGAEWLFTATFTYFIVFNLEQPRTFVSEMNSLSSICQFFSTAFFMMWCAKRGFKRPFIIAILIVVSSVIGYVGVYYLNIPHLTGSLLASLSGLVWGRGGILHSVECICIPCRC